jgi:hypothetical protein
MKFIEIEEVWEVNPSRVMANRPPSSESEHKVWAVYCGKGVRDHQTEVQAELSFLVQETELLEEQVREVLNCWANVGVARMAEPPA